MLGTKVEPQRDFLLKSNCGVIRFFVGGFQMISKRVLSVLFSVLLLVFGCATTQPKIPMDMASGQPGDRVMFQGKPVKLIGPPISIGKPLPSVDLVDAMTMSDVDLSKERALFFSSALSHLSIPRFAMHRLII